MELLRTDVLAVAVKPLYREFLLIHTNVCIRFDTWVLLEVVKPLFIGFC